MKYVKLLSRHAKIVIGLAVLSFAPAVHATQPLAEFLSSARLHSFAAREQGATVVQRRAEEDQALGRLLPTVTARGSLTHNQYEAALPAGVFPGQTQAIVITPQNQLEGVLQLDIPLVDLAALARRDQAKQLTQLAELQQQLVGLDLDRAVTRLYTSFVGTSALVLAAEQSLALAEKNLDTVTTRRELGAATELDRMRALSNLERARQDLTDAQLGRALTSRQLETLTFITPEPVSVFPDDALAPEAPLTQWLAVSDTPADRVQHMLSEIADTGEVAANRALLPTLSVNAQERITNATGFAGRSSSYALQAVLSWRLDYGTIAATKVQDSAVELQRVRSQRARRELEDGVFDAFQRVESGIAKSRSARAQVAAAEQAAALAAERYQAGVATQLDVTQSQRDAYLAVAARIQADAELSYARASLRLAAGQAAGASSQP